MTAPKGEITRILVVDDEKRFLDSHREILVNAGFDCSTASDDQTALECMSEGDISLALIDVAMLGLPEPDLFAEIREKYPWAAVVLVGEDDRRDAAVGHIKKGALDYLVKPIDGSHLVQAVNEALERHKNRMEGISQQQHLEELLVHQSKALENKIQEVKALNRILAGVPNT